MKSDGESAITSLRQAIAQRLGRRVTMDSPPKDESASNGRIEEAGKTTPEITRVLKFQLEEYAGISILPQDVVTQWMMR